MTDGAIKVCLGQLPACPEGSIENNLASIDRLCSYAAGRGARVVVTPELFVNGYKVLVKDGVTREVLEGHALDTSPEAEGRDGAVLRRLCDIAARHSVHIVTGALTVRVGAGGRDFMNSALWVGPEPGAGGRRLLGLYHKCHLWDSERRVFTEGDEPCVTVEALGMRFALMICYDIDFPEAARIARVRGNASAIVCITAAANTPSTQPHYADIILPARAVENECYTLYCNYPGSGGTKAREATPFFGRSLVCAPTGTFLQRSGTGECVLFAELDPAPGGGEWTIPNLRDRRPALYRSRL